MKTIPAILLCSLLTMALFSAVLYSSCKKNDPCETKVCQNNGVCYNGACICLPGFGGDRCTEKTCNNITCYNGSFCGSGKCHCLQNFTGPYCQTDLCKGIVCENGGTCVAGICKCPENFTGPNCEIDLCKGIVCQNGGTCKKGNCDCPSAYEGRNCETLVREKFLGTWKGYDGHCIYSDSVIIIIDDSGLSDPGLANVHYGTAYNITAQVVKGTLDGGFGFNGSNASLNITLLDEQHIILYIEYTDLGQTTKCSGIYERQ